MLEKTMSLASKNQTFLLMVVLENHLIRSQLKVLIEECMVFPPWCLLPATTITTIVFPATVWYFQISSVKKVVYD